MSDGFIDEVRVLRLRYGSINERRVGRSIDGLKFADFWMKETLRFSFEKMEKEIGRTVVFCPIRGNNDPSLSNNIKSGELR